MSEVIDLALSELKSRFSDEDDRLYELNVTSRSSDVHRAILRAHLEALYPNMVDVDMALAQFDIVRRIRIPGCPPSMTDLRKLYLHDRDDYSSHHAVLSVNAHSVNWH